MSTRKKPICVRTLTDYWAGAGAPAEGLLVLKCDTADNAVNLFAPDPADFGWLVLFNSDGSNNLVLYAHAGGPIEGSTTVTITMTNKGSAVELFSDGTEWEVSNKTVVIE